MVTIFQIKKIHMLKNILGIDENLYRELLCEFGVNSSKELNYPQAKMFIEILEDKAVECKLWKKQPKKYEELNRDKQMATDAQLRMIDGLWQEICYFDDEKYAKTSLRKFLKSKHKVDDVMFLTKQKASKVIQSIIAFKRNIKRSVTTL